MRLVYFNFGGTAEAIRLAFHLRGIPFEDVRLTAAEFQNQRDSFPHGKLPVLQLTDHDGNYECIPQSAAILRFAGRVDSNNEEAPLLYPLDPLEALQCDALVDAVQDLNEALRPTMVEFLPELQHESMLELRQSLASNFFPNWLKSVSYQLNPEGPFAMGSRMYICDLALFCRLKWLRKGILEGIPATMVDDHPRLLQLMRAVQNAKDIEGYYKNHEMEKTGWVMD